MKDFKYYLDKVGEVGFVESVTESNAIVSGLPSIKPTEKVLFERGELGVSLFLNRDSTEVLLLSKGRITPGQRVARTGEELTVPIGKAFLGYVVDCLGRPIFPPGGIKADSHRRILDMSSPGIESRISVRRPLETGVALVDVLVPLGKGQRELVIGDRKTGKTSFLLQTVLRQARQGTICLYGAVGRKQTEIKEIKDFFTKNEVMDKIILVASSVHDANGLIYLTPYTACVMAEYFRDLGLDTLVVLDDLTTHAKFYREICLLAKRFPGRDSYPVDIFFAHAGILEKGGNFKTDAPGGASSEASITILPVAQTAAQDLSGYIQTNLMSMTDGHIYFDSDLFAKGRRPAINPFLSVTRVGRQAQTALKREINREMMAFLTNYEKLQSFVHFGAELTEEAKEILLKGERIINFFEQSEATSLDSNIVVYVLSLIWKGAWLDKTSQEAKKEFLQLVAKYQTDRKFKKKVNRIVDKSESFKELIKKIKS